MHVGCGKHLPICNTELNLQYKKYQLTRIYKDKSLKSEHKTKPIKYVPTDDKNIYYPETDGRPLAETDLHRINIIDTYHKLKSHYEEEDDVYVSGNLLIYDIQGKPQRSISPDVMVVIGIEKKMRRTYKIWEEGKAPDFVMEFSSKSTYTRDLGRKKTRYASMSVFEYFLYDPERSYLSESLMGFRLNENSKYDVIDFLRQGGLQSEVLGIEFRIQEDEIGLFDSTSGECILTPEEKANNARKQAEAETARLRKEIEELKVIREKYEN